MRSLIQVLRHPLNDAEEQRASEYIRQACQAIRSTWTEGEHRRRANWTRADVRKYFRCRSWTVPEMQTPVEDADPGEEI